MHGRPDPRPRERPLKRAVYKKGLQKMSEGKFRLVTRSDFDGLVCAVLLKELNMIDDIKFVHPKDMQDLPPVNHQLQL